MSEHFRKRKQVEPLPAWGCVAVFALVLAIWLTSGVLAHMLGSLLFEWMIAT